MMYDKARQHSNTGKWFMVSGNRRGSYVICGCTAEEGHDTQEEAERHFYETCIEKMSLNDVHRTASANKCIVCEAWTPTFLGAMNFSSCFSSLQTYLCDEHMPKTDEDVRAKVRELRPFSPGYESWHS